MVTKGEGSAAASNLVAGKRRPRYAPGMDARTRKHGHIDEETVDEARVLAETITAKRDRLLASLTLIAGLGLILVVPFALRAGAEVFMPVTAALVVAIALVPLLEWFERRGMPSTPSQWWMRKVMWKPMNSIQK